MKMNKEEISHIAINLFLEKGYKNVTIHDICDKCGITKPTFYKYVTSKEDLILDLYDVTIKNLVTDTYHFLQASTHIEQLFIIFHTIIKDTLKFGSDLFSQMLISNLNQDRHSFEMRESLTKLSIIIIEKAQEKGEIKNMNSPKALYNSLAHTFTGYEVLWCISNGMSDFEKDMYESINVILDVREDLRDIFKKYL